MEKPKCTTGINGSKQWWLNGRLHREDGPAIEWPGGGKEWWLNGKNLTEVEHAEQTLQKPKCTTGINGSKQWWLNGRLHREDGPAFERADGSEQWWFNGERHREDGSAVEYADGTKEWWLNGKLHREDGPAIEWLNGSKRWYLNGKNLTEMEHTEQTKKSTSEIGDSVNHPQHYNVGKIEVIDAIEDWGLGFNDGNVVKYIARAAHKGNQIEDLKKAQWYLERAIKVLEATKE
jgi:hypothetical protein